MDLNPSYSTGSGAADSKEEAFKSILSPIEPLIMQLQSLLVWENPRRSVAVFLLVHGLFWFLATTDRSFYFLASVTGMVLFLVDTWKKKIWPAEIRAPSAVPEDSDGWTPVHPRLLSVPEISHHFAHYNHSVSSYLESWLSFRRNHSIQFCLLNFLGFLALAILGHYIPGIMISYIVVMSLLLWPCVVYHSLLQKCYLKFEPLFMRLDYTLKMRAPWRNGNRGRGSDGEEQSGAVMNSDKNEFDLEDLYPSTDPVTTAALARAITDSEDEGGTPATSTPALSTEPSLTASDDENELEEHDLAEGLGEMPSFDDTLENSRDETFPSILNLESDMLIREPDLTNDNVLDFGSHRQNSSGHLTENPSQLIASQLITQAMVNSLVETTISQLNPFSLGDVPSSAMGSKNSDSGKNTEMSNLATHGSYSDTDTVEDFELLDAAELDDADVI